MTMMQGNKISVVLMSKPWVLLCEVQTDVSGTLSFLGIIDSTTIVSMPIIDTIFILIFIVIAIIRIVMLIIIIVIHIDIISAKWRWRTVIGQNIYELRFLRTLCVLKASSANATGHAASTVRLRHRCLDSRSRIRVGHVLRSCLVTDWRGRRQNPLCAWAWATLCRFDRYRIDYKL